MGMRLWPRSIRWQMLAGLVLLEALSILLFALLLISRQASEVHERARLRLGHQATSMALQASEALRLERPDWVGLSVTMMGETPGVRLAKVTDPAGNVLFVSAGEPAEMGLERVEAAQIPLKNPKEPTVFDFDVNRMESVDAIYTHGELRGYAWVETDRAWDYEQLNLIERGTVIFGIIWILASVVLVLLVARAISRPLALLHRGTRALMLAPDGESSFPLPVTVRNEFGDLIEAFNRMVASIKEQRAGLKNTLSMLDSMLANAPIGLVFFDRNCRFVRVNEVFAGMTGAALNSHLGRTLSELVPSPVAQQMEDAVQRVFATGEPVRDLELSGRSGRLNLPWTWLVSAYPVRTQPDEVRWVGVVVLDTTERKRSEEALRRTEKLAATGRLAASIAHEINNPLEAVTNLLFLLKNYCNLEAAALDYATMAEHEVKRIAEITQQTLRFYRQSTLPARASMSDLLDSILNLYQVRLQSKGIVLERTYDPALDLYCFAGEVRQVIANLLVNAMDAMPGGGRLRVRAKQSRNWAEPGLEGVRITVADTGIGMDAEVRARIFEAFFTTKDVTGTGLGLWVSQEIIVKHHGLVHVRSRTAEGGKSPGTVFQLFFPDHQALAAQVTQPAVAAQAAS
ncbi:MAG: ATP-binding protein [Terracidiphilus sp.]